jgi:hypothetical protein
MLSIFPFRYRRTIFGVVGDIRQDSLESAHTPAVH